MMVMAIRVDAFLEENEYFERVEKLIAGIKATPTAAGFQEISMPGERESRLAEQRKNNGVPVLESLYNEVLGLKK
jgi:LDH2 family malate/lactate/ureidoglycolate dehydrogenase